MASGEPIDDPLGARPSTVVVDDIPKWSETEPPDYEDTAETNQLPILYNQDINEKVALWSGDITLLAAEAIVNSTNESMSEKSPLSEVVFQKAGPQLRQEIKRDVRNCKTGEARLTKAYQLPSRYIIHTVGPRYNARYQTAAENALYNCYRNTLQLAREKKIRTIGLCCVHSPRRHYPVQEGAHIALRTVRRFLEHFMNDFDSVIFVVMDADHVVYERLMSCYFPRSSGEARHCAPFLPDNMGNEFGEPVIPERQIRICNKPLIAADVQADLDYDSDDAPIHEQLELSMAVGKHDFSKMELDHDVIRRMKVKGRASIETDRIFNIRRYNGLLKRARTENFTELSALRCLYQSGYDNMGRPILVFIGKHFIYDDIDLERGILYLIHVMDHLVAQKFSVIYVLTESGRDNQPSMAYLREIYRLLDDRYRNNLHQFYILHPTVWSRMVIWWFLTFTATQIKDRVTMVHGVENLYADISPDQLDLPPFVMDYDLKVNGTRYYVPHDGPKEEL